MKTKAADKKTLRAFIAVPVPLPVSEHLRKIQVHLKTSGVHLRWVNPEAIHLTLKFFGEIDPKRILAVVQCMDQSAANIPSFSLRSEGVGVFPGLRRARVVWAGLAGDLPVLSELQTTVEKSMATLGFAREKKRFRPHFTLGRSKGKLDGRVLEESLRSFDDVCSRTFVVDRFSLLKSVLTPTGATYTVLHTSHLTGGSPPEEVQNAANQCSS